MPSSAPSPKLPLPFAAVSIRPAYPDDAAVLERLARLDSRRPLTGPVLVAERDGRIVAALATADGATIADPFAPTADLVSLLRVHAADTASTLGRRDILRRVGVNARRLPALARG
ncbi:MAG TPA: hypothetical protein VI318_11985 [Baekduia sp.]